MSESEKSKVLSIALLLEGNENLSASAAGLKERAINRRGAKKIALELLGLSEEKFQEIYETVLRMRELRQYWIEPKDKDLNHA